MYHPNSCMCLITPFHFHTRMNSLVDPDTLEGYSQINSGLDNLVHLGSTNSFDEPLVPPNDAWPTWDAVEAFTYTPEMLGPPPKHKNQEFFTHSFSNEPLSDVPSSSKNRKNATRSGTTRIPRPRNAFMIYRSSFTAQKKIPTTIEHDHRRPFRSLL